MPDYSKNPIKTLYTIFFLASLPTRLVYLALKATPRALRPHPKWSFHQTFGTAAFRLWWDYATAVEFRTGKSLEPGSDGERFITMAPADPGLYQGVLHDQTGKVKPVTIGGMWYPALYSPSADAGKKVILQFHGGAYVLGGCRPMESGWGPEVLATSLGGFTLQTQYRLATYENSHFPAALQDAVTSYAYLLRLGVKPQDIIISGDSAGGNMAIALLRWLEEFKKSATGLPLPRAILLWSPWVDLTVQPAVLDSSPNWKTDYLRSPLAVWALKKYLPAGIEANHPYVSPLGNEFATSVPVFVQTGTAEVLYPGHVEFAKNMTKISGNKVELLEIEDATHDTFAAGQILGFEKEAREAVQKASSMVNNSQYSN